MNLTTTSLVYDIYSIVDPIYIPNNKERFDFFLIKEHVCIQLIEGPKINFRIVFFGEYFNDFDTKKIFTRLFCTAQNVYQLILKLVIVLAYIILANFEVGQMKQNIF